MPQTHFKDMSCKLCLCYYVINAKISMKSHKNIIHERLAQEKNITLYSYIYICSTFMYIWNIWMDLCKSIILNCIISAFNFKNYIICHLLDLYIWQDIILSTNKAFIATLLNWISPPPLLTRHRIKYKQVLFIMSIVPDKTINNITIIQPH